MLREKFILRVSDIETAIKDWKMGYYSEEEFVKKIRDLCEAILIDREAEDRDKEMAKEMANEQLIEELRQQEMARREFDRLLEVL